MLDFQRKKKVRQLMYSPLVVGLIIIVALYALYSTWSVYQKFLQSKRELNQSESSELTLDKQNTDLDGQISALHTTQGVEDEIRSKYGMAKAGEALAIISDDQSTASSTAVSQSWWHRFLSFLGL